MDGGVDDSLSKRTAPQAPPFRIALLERGTVPSALRHTTDRAFRDSFVTDRELRSEPVVLNLWASWCVPCKREAPVLARGWQWFGPRGVLFVGLDIEDLSANARRFMRKYDLTYPTLRQQNRELANRYGATGIPETYFISARGFIRGHVIGALSDAQLATGIASARGGPILGTQRGGARETSQ